jgi:hypothetical protein
MHIWIVEFWPKAVSSGAFHSSNLIVGFSQSFFKIQRGFLFFFQWEVKKTGRGPVGHMGHRQYIHKSYTGKKITIPPVRKKPETCLLRTVEATTLVKQILY